MGEFFAGHKEPIQLNHVFAIHKLAQLILIHVDPSYEIFQLLVGKFFLSSFNGGDF